MKGIFDVHTHIHFPAYDVDRETVIKRAQEVGVKMITVGTTAQSSEEAIKLSIKYPDDIWASVGYHPTNVSPDWYHDQKEQKEAEKEEFDAKRLEKVAMSERVVAIGECGLDYFRLNDEDLKTREEQKKVLLAQMEIAHKLQKPLMIHCRSAFDDLISLFVSNFGLLKKDCSGVIHFFSGTINNAEELLELGFCFSFGGVVTFSRDYDEVIKMIPIKNILLETDAPYVSPAPYRGRRNESSYVIEAAKRIAEIKEMTLDEVINETTKNAERIFNIK